MAVSELTLVWVLGSTGIDGGINGGNGVDNCIDGYVR